MTGIQHKLTPEEHVELLALYSDMGSNIENIKKRSFGILVSYSAVSAFVSYKQNEFSFDMQGIIFFLLLIGVILCAIVIHENYKNIVNRREVLEYIFAHFSDVFNQARKPLEKNGKTITNKGPVDTLVHIVQLLYPLIVLLILFQPRFEWKEGNDNNHINLSFSIHKVSEIKAK